MGLSLNFHETYKIFFLNFLKNYGNEIYVDFEASSGDILSDFLVQLKSRNSNNLGSTGIQFQKCSFVWIRWTLPSNFQKKIFLENVSSSGPRKLVSTKFQAKMTPWNVCQCWTLLTKLLLAKFYLTFFADAEQLSYNTLTSHIIFDSTIELVISDGRM